MEKIVIWLLVCIVVLQLLVAGILFQIKPASLGAGIGTVPVVGTTTVFTTVAGTVQELFATSTCSSRVITTGPAIVIEFSDFLGGNLNTNNIGYWQAASSSVSYTKLDYGCGRWRVRGDAAGTLRLTEFR